MKKTKCDNCGKKLGLEVEKPKFGFCSNRCFDLFVIDNEETVKEAVIKPGDDKRHGTILKLGKKLLKKNDILPK